MIKEIINFPITKDNDSLKKETIQCNCPHPAAVRLFIPEKGIYIKKCLKCGKEYPDTAQYFCLNTVLNTRGIDALWTCDAEETFAHVRQAYLLATAEYKNCTTQQILEIVKTELSEK